MRDAFRRLRTRLAVAARVAWDLLRGRPFVICLILPTDRAWADGPTRTEAPSGIEIHIGMPPDALDEIARTLPIAASMTRLSAEADSILQAAAVRRPPLPKDP